ncbi:MAG: GNAT family N-acetyltransferase, partial [bacterium]|nr:GNAT family N-acetyltransferase [bacterium]
MIIKASIKDAKSIYRLISSFARKGIMLSRSLNYIYENIRDFWVYKENNRLLGCCSLHVIGWNNLAEIKSLSVHPSAQKHGIGRDLIKMCMEEAAILGVRN